MKTFKKMISMVICVVLALSMMAGTVDVRAAAKAKLSKKSVTLTAGSSKKITLKAGKKKAKGVKWKSKNKKIASVKGGMIKAHKPGKTKIIATYKKKKYTCKVTVKAAQKTTSQSSSKAKDSKPSAASKDSTQPQTKPSTDQSSTNKPSTEKTSTEQPSSENPSTEQPSSENPSTERPSTQEPEEFDFQLQSDAYKIQKSDDGPGMYDEELSFTKSNQMITLSPRPSSLASAGLGAYEGYEWYKDGKKITKESLKIDTTVDQAQFAATEPGVYQLKLKTTRSTYDPEKGKNVKETRELTSNKVTIKPRADIIGSSNIVEVHTEESSINGNWAYKDPETGRNYIYPIKLKRELVSFDPWPTTVEQVEYVITHTKDPFVIGALYVVAMDNFNVVDDDGDGQMDVNQDGIAQRGITSMMMTNAIATGAFMDGLSLEQLGIQPSEKSTMQTGGYVGLGIKAPKPGAGGAFSGTPTTDKKNGYVYKYAPRTYCQGATNANGYAPNGKAEDVLDRTKWKIVVDQYPYCFDQVAYGSPEADESLKFDGVNESGEIAVQVKEKGASDYKEEWIPATDLPVLRKDANFVTVCPEHFQLEMPNEGMITVNNENKLVRIGLLKKNQIFVPTDYAAMNQYKHDSEMEPVHYNYQGQGVFSNGYAAPEVSIDDPGPTAVSH